MACLVIWLLVMIQVLLRVIQMIRVVQLLVERSQSILYHGRDIPVSSAEVDRTVLIPIVVRFQPLLAYVSIMFRASMSFLRRRRRWRNQRRFVELWFLCLWHLGLWLLCLRLWRVDMWFRCLYLWLCWLYMGLLDERLGVVLLFWRRVSVHGSQEKAGADRGSYLGGLGRRTLRATALPAPDRCRPLTKARPGARSIRNRYNKRLNRTSTASGVIAVDISVEAAGVVRESFGGLSDPNCPDFLPRLDKR
jgi:hypothetical protein